MIRIALIVCSMSALLIGVAQADVRPVKRHDNDRDRREKVSSIEYVPRIWSPNDVDDALKLTESKELVDVVGGRCWRLWRPAAVVMEIHPLPKIPVKASDLQVARLVKITLSKLQADSECKFLSDRILDAWGPFDNAVTPHAVRRTIFSGALGP